MSERAPRSRKTELPIEEHERDVLNLYEEFEEELKGSPEFKQALANAYFDTGEIGEEFEERGTVYFPKGSYD
jgi:hypothetical protein